MCGRMPQNWSFLREKKYANTQQEVTLLVKRKSLINKLELMVTTYMYDSARIIKKKVKTKDLTTEM